MRLRARAAVAAAISVALLSQTAPATSVAEGHGAARTGAAPAALRTSSQQIQTTVDPRAPGAAGEFPADPREFVRTHRPPARPLRRGLAHQLLRRPLRVSPARPRPGQRGSGPAVSPGALDPAKAPKNVGAVVVAYMARTNTHTPPPTPTPVPLARSRAIADSGAKRAASVDISAQNVTGINHWWSYEEGTIPGVGRWMVNAYSGNLIVQADDLDVKHRGIDLAFRRTYNSFSRHDFAGTDGATEIGQYGSGWTNTFDAHLSTNGCPNTGYAWAGFYGFSVHDVDGARYDYCFDASGRLVPPPGMQGTTLVANPDGGSFYWTKKNGTQYTFYAPYYGGTSAAYSGRVYRISGRNQNNYIQFTYAWSPDASSSGNLTNIYAATDNGGSQATLTFANFNGQQLLSQLTRPDGAVITYDYDAAGELIAVTKPGPNDTGTPAVESYNGYQSALMVTSPRWNAGRQPDGTPGDGGYVAFFMDETTTAQVAGIEWVGVMNFAPGDGTGVLLQPAVAPGAILYRWEGVAVTLTYTAFSDTDGHGQVQYLDGAGRPTVRQAYTGSQWLQTTETWDAANDLTAETDARGNASDYAYDIDGNTVAAAAPPPVPGALRPTRLFSYDAHDNLTASCDANATQGLGFSWTAPPAAPVPGQGGLCPQNTAATRYQWAATTSEPFGELTAAITPLTATSVPNGYQRTFSYDAGPQGGVDYGLPTRVTGTAIAQNDPSTPTRTPQQTFWYDANGNLVCYGTGSGQWLLGYDSFGRLTTAADPDDALGGTGVCGKTGAQPNLNTTAHTSYFPDGSISKKQTAAQYALGIGTTFTYDLDGDVLTETHHYGCTSPASCTAGVTTKWYDGADRLIEVQQPYDASDIQQYPWSTRYIYDLSQGGVTPYRGMGLPGYGNLVATQELLSGTVWAPAYGQTYGISSAAWTDVRASSFDALDRPLSAYEAAFGDQPKTTNGYDGPGAAGLLSSVRLASGELKSYVYDALGRRTDVLYPNDPNGTVTPSIHEGYDADGHVTSRQTSVLGAESIAFDSTGAVTSVTEPASLGGGTISYGYYADGLRSSAGYAAGSLTYSNVLQYAYRADGQRERLSVDAAGAFIWSYTAAGRLQTQSDPLTGTTIHPDVTYTNPKGLEQPFYPSSMTYTPWTAGYDTYGRVLSITFPVSQFAYTSSQFDLDDGVAQHVASGYPSSALPQYKARTVCLLSTVRNEKTPLAQMQQSSCVLSGVPNEIDGAQLSGSGPAGRLPISQNWTLDARSGMLQHNTAQQNGETVGSSYAYDESGRLVQDFEGAMDHIGVGSTSKPTFTAEWCPGAPNSSCYSNGSRNKTYDAENRLRSETFTSRTPYTITSYGASDYGSYWRDTSGYGQPANIQSVDYGSTSHPMRFALYHPDLADNPNNTANETRAWLWDGDDRFLECRLVNGQCQSPTLSLEGLGDYDLTGGAVLRVNDRNRYGLVAMSRDATTFGGWVDMPMIRTQRALYAPCSTGNVDTGVYNSGSVCGPQHDGKLTADGWSLDYETWQGVRTSDLTIGQWNTPDAYAGEVHDPSTQKPFMWNRNNPYEYSDPSGYQPEDARPVWARFFTAAFGNRMATWEEKEGAAISEQLQKQAASEAATKGGVYKLQTQSGITVRNGRTGNLATRERAHARSYSGLRFEVQYRTDSYEAQRGLEQMEIERDPGILDKLNGISPKNPNKDSYMDAARQFINALKPPPVKH
jgi:YD repeat-containing protein